MSLFAFLIVKFVITSYCRCVRCTLKEKMQNQENAKQAGWKRRGPGGRIVHTIRVGFRFLPLLPTLPQPRTMYKEHRWAWRGGMGGTPPTEVHFLFSNVRTFLRPYVLYSPPEALNSTFARPPMTRSKRREESSDHRRDFIARVFFCFLPPFPSLCESLRTWSRELLQEEYSEFFYLSLVHFKAERSRVAWLGFFLFSPLLLFLPGYRSSPRAPIFCPGQSSEVRCSETWTFVQLYAVCTYQSYYLERRHSENGKNTQLVIFLFDEGIIHNPSLHPQPIDQCGLE